MRTILLAVMAVATLAVGAPASAAPADTAVAAAIADPSRPQDDRDRDAARKPAEILTLAEVGPGDRVADLYAGSGYFTRILSGAVGRSGKVYVVLPEEATKSTWTPRPIDVHRALVAEPAVAANTTLLIQPMKAFAPPEKLDLVLASQFHHDLHNPFFGGPDPAPAIRAIFEALRPGGIYMVIDHSAQDGSGLRDVTGLHRIDQAAAEAEIKAAGFVLEARSEVLRNPDDPRTANVFAPAIRGKTDQFVLKFRKPS